MNPGWRRARLTLWAPGVAFVAAIVLLACGGGDGDGDDGGDSGLVGTSWQVDELRGADGSLGSPEPDTVLSATFDDAQISGLSGCNSFVGPYTIDGSGFEAGPFAGTLRACEPASIMDQEVAYTSLLQSADGWSRAGDTLELRSGDDVTLRFTAAATPELEGTAWSLLAYNDQREAVVSVALDTEITMSFDADGVSGSAGCNSYDADYDAEGPTLTFGVVAATERFCAEPDLVMEQEALFLENLPLVATHDFTSEGNLEMFAEGGERLLLFRPAS